jgi:hypothetical protein
MFFLHFLPDAYLLWVVNTVLLLGAIGTIAGFFIKYIPFLNQYQLLLNILSTILLVAGVYFKGGYGVEMEWRNRVAELEQKIEIAEQQSKEVNVQIETRVVEKVKVIKEKVYATKKIIQEHKEIINAECTVPDVARVLYNSAVNNELPKGTSILDGVGTDVKDIISN